MKIDVTSFPLYEMLTLSLVTKPEVFFRNMVDRFARVFGATRVALLLRTDRDEIFRYWGFREEPSPEDIPKIQGENTYFAAFDDGELGFLFVEHATRLSQQNRIFYSMVLPVLEKSLELRRAHSRLAESQRWYSRIFHTAHEAIVVTNKNHELQDASGRLEEILGYTLEELRGRTLFGIIHQEDLQKVSEEAGKRPRGRSSVYEMRFVHREGHPVWVRVSASPIIDDEGRFHGTLGFFSDIDKRKKAEIEKARQRLFFESLFRIVPEALAVVEKNHMVVEINEAFTKLFGFTPEDCQGRNLDDVLDTGKAGSADRVLTSKVLQGQEVVTESVRHAKDGRPIEVMVKASPINTGEESSGAIIMYLDITEQKAYESYLQRESFMDPLTGLYNRNYFEKMMKKLQKDNAAFPMVVMVMDMDNLKEINDTRGHAEGDECLETAGYLLKKSVRREDILARIGGDEFAVILPRSDKATGARLSERIQKAVTRENERKGRQAPLALSLSIGYHVAETFGESLEETFEKADAAMYSQKTRKKRMRAQRKNGI